MVASQQVREDHDHRTGCPRKQRHGRGGEALKVASWLRPPTEAEGRSQTQ